MRIKKTIRVCDLRDEINRRNRESTCPRGVRVGWNCILEHVLSLSDQYAGFRYLDPTEIPTGELPGIAEQTDDRYPKSLENLSNGKYKFPDDTRREYLPIGGGA